MPSLAAQHEPRCHQGRVALYVLCRKLASSLKAWYVSVSLRPKLSPDWIVQLKKILVMACQQLAMLKVRAAVRKEGVEFVAVLPVFTAVLSF